MSTLGSTPPLRPVQLSRHSSMNICLAKLAILVEYVFLQYRSFRSKFDFIRRSAFC
ncbi:hypothetical protein GQ43DRAFT_210692 [Delitschia confertaspora ATCC 74209]|uniref:Uncharacterized protein n=1 Tax=Delitschia confertaspora ATCC 74209 TaxID=1513339 RepID=A0A9P4MX68_9PLEO|nr:hypothetical protein GQ43DRAFT_210692 [Delitschia confertaspora ATCC 74209]